MARESKIGPEQALPHSPEFATTEDYVASLLDFVASDDLLRVLCGGVHILDFFTTDPPLYHKVLPASWRSFFAQHDVMDILDLLLRDELPRSENTSSSSGSSSGAHVNFDSPRFTPSKWTTAEPVPPPSLLAYIRRVRLHLLHREHLSLSAPPKLARHVAVGMNVKKVHEVGVFAAYIDQLAKKLEAAGRRRAAPTGCEGDPSANNPEIHDDQDGGADDRARISHLVDFGSGQNYLGRALASEPYQRNIVAIESKQANAERAKVFDVMAKLSQKEKIMRNKKMFRTGQMAPGGEASPGLPTPPPEAVEPETVDVALSQLELPTEDTSTTGHAKIQYIQHRIESGDLRPVTAQIPPSSPLSPHPNHPHRLLVMSLHSCGNLVHHGLRSLTADDSVAAVAMVGCCYNLITERLGPASYKLPELRPTTFTHARLGATGEARDPHGFPMSRRLCDYYCTTEQEAADGGEDREESGRGLGAGASRGVRLNITARMMAVQAPGNWGPTDSADFFTRHFYRALLQRVFLDRGVVGRPTPECVGGSPAGHSSGGTPIVIGSLRKSCYANFVAYTRGAVAKLVLDAEHGSMFQNKMGGITDEELQAYEESFRERKKELSVIWSLMAFSAGVIEAVIVADRWLWLTEQDEVQEAWAEPVFDYKLSPRNIVVVGIKK